jgi:prepilin-type N-terminal cleavage/methylation domain-containing protein
MIFKKPYINLLSNTKGFTLVEVLVALFLLTMSMAFMMDSIGSSNPREELEKTVDDLQKAIRFSRDEAILRGRITRLYIELDSDPQTYRVEFGPDEKFTLPSFLTDDPDKVSSREKEENKKKEKKLNNSFTPMEEFQGEPIQINENTIIKSIGTTLTNTTYGGGNISLFFYPSGEKDGGFFLIASGDSMATLTYEAFTNDIEENYYEIEEDSDDEDILEAYFSDKAKEFFEKWNKN